jgi:hypothetical protein
MRRAVPRDCPPLAYNLHLNAPLCSRKGGRRICGECAGEVRGEDFVKMSMSIKQRAAHHGMSVAEYGSRLRHTWDLYHGAVNRPFIEVAEAAWMPAPGSELDVHGDWQRTPCATSQGNRDE